MNLNPLYELKERLESSVIAGVSLLSEDFRLARAVEQMEPLSKASPVFAKIYQSAKGLLSDSCTNPADTILDILAFLDAVLTTQAAVGVSGDLETMVLTEGKVHAEAPYSQLAPALEALTTTGSGHFSTIVELHEQKPELFWDYRLRSAMLAGLNAGYAELAERIEEWLGAGDASILPLLKRDFDPKGKKEMVRRVHVIERIGKDTENAWYLAQLEEAQKDVRAALIYALRHCPENQELLMGFTKTEKGNGKKAAMWALAEMQGEENRKFWEQQLQKKPENTKYLALSKSDAASDLTAEAITSMLESFKQGKAFIISDAAFKTFSFRTMIGKASPKMLELYRTIVFENIFDRLQNEKQQAIQLEEYTTDRQMKAPPVRYLAGILTDSLVWSMDERLFSLAEELYETQGSWFLMPALTAALLSKPKEEVYEAFSKLLVREGVLTKESEQQKILRLELADTFARVVWDREEQKYCFCARYYDEFKDKQIYVLRSLKDGLDSRWFQALTNPKLKKSGSFHTYQYGQSQSQYYYQGQYYYGYYGVDWDSILARLVNPFDKEGCQTLGQYFYERALETKKNNQRYFGLLRLCGFDQCRGIVVERLKQGTIQYWNMGSMVREAPLSPKDKVKELEEIKRLFDAGEIHLTGWNEERYEDLHTELLAESL